MPDTNCRSCGSKLEVNLVCKFCNQPVRLTCGICGYISDEKVHVDCMNAEFLVTHR